MSSIDNKIIREKLSWYRGTIISDSTVIEGALGWRLRTYFFPKSNKQAAIFYWNIINTSHFSFDRKISLYQQIPYFRRLKNYPEIINSLRFVQKLRNAIAHWELDEGMSDANEVVIYNPSTFKKIKLNNKLMKEFIAHDKLLLNSFGWKYTLEEKYGTLSQKTFGSSRDTQIRAFGGLLSKSGHIQ